MKTLMMALAAAIAVASPAVAAEKKCDGAKKPCQEKCAEAKPRQEKRVSPEEGMRHGAGPWVAHMLVSGDNLEKIGIEDEKLREEIKSSLKAQRKKSAELEKKIREVSREQAKMMRTFLSEKGCSAEDLYAKIDEVSRLRAKQGRIAVESMAILRDKLTPQQLKAAMKLIKRGAMYRGGREGGPAGGRYRRGMRDGEGPRPEMRDGEGPRPEMRDGEGPRPEMGDDEDLPNIKRDARKGEGKSARKGKRPEKKRRPPVADDDGDDDDDRDDRD